MAAFMTMRKAEIANMRPWVPGDGQSLGVDLERRTATFLGKGGKPRTVHYGALAEFDWPMLPHLRDFPERFVKLFEEHVEQRQDDVRRGMELRWLHPWTEGASRPDRDNPKLDVWFASKADLKRFDRRWQAALKQAGYAEREYTPHQLRHFAAMNMWRAGTSWERLKREMGHDQEATTHAYLNFRPEYDRERRRNEVARADEPQE
jgi:integrase